MRIRIFLTTIPFVLVFGIQTLLAQNQNSYFSELRCNTWGKPDWTKVDRHFSITEEMKTGARYREFDRNIRSLTDQKEFAFYNDEQSVRWILQDTTILQMIKIVDDKQILYMNTSTACGIKIKANTLAKENNSDYLLISVERKRTDMSFNRGIEIMLHPGRDFMDKKFSIDSLYSTANGKRFGLVDFYIRRKLALDALTTLEQLAEKNNSDTVLVKKYWDVVNDLMISR